MGMNSADLRASKLVAEEYQDEDGEWRVRLKVRRKLFDDSAKEIFLSEFSKHGRLGDAARAADVSPKTVKTHMEKDPDFAEACLEAEETYKSRLLAHHQDLLFKGQEKVTYDRNGNVVSKETVYPIRLIELELKAHDDRYRDKKEVDMKVSGGVLVAPPDVTSIDDWEARFALADPNTIEGEFTEVRGDQDKETE